MPKAAAQRLPLSRIRRASATGTPVAVYTGFKRGFCEHAVRATVVGVGRYRTVYRNADDLEGRIVDDGVAIYYDTQDRSTEDAHIVAPSDILDDWDHYRSELTARDEARRAAQERSLKLRSEADEYARDLEGVVMNSPAGVLGIFLPFDVAQKVVGNLKGGPG